MSTYAIPPEFDERGIKPLVHGIPDYPKAAQTRALARKIKRDGVTAPDGTHVATFDETNAALLAHPWAYPQQISGQLAAPQAITIQAGTLYYVSGLALSTRLIPPYHNSRARSKLPIPKVGEDGRVDFPWPTRDVTADPDGDHRLLVEARDLSTLAAAAHATAMHVESMQSSLKGALGREGAEEQVLLVPARFDVADGHLDDDLVWVTADGGSRLTILQGFLADVIDAVLADEERGMTAKRRNGLKELGVNLRARLAGLLSHDPVAERDLRDELERLLEEPAADLVKSGLYAGQRALVVPARAVVAFVPHGESTVLDATQQLIGNAHKRGPKPWDASSRSVDTRDEVLRKLSEAGKLSEEELLLYGPTYEEAYERFGTTDNPDYRAGELVRFFHEGDPLTDDARRAMKDTLRTGKLMPSARAAVIAAAVLEQVRDTDPKRREKIETTLNEILSHKPFFGTDVPWPSRDPDVDDLLREAAAEQGNDPKGWGPAKLELAIKGGLALTMVGALNRPWGTEESQQRSYNVLLRIAHDPFGQELLGEAIRALREGEDHIPALDADTREPLGSDGAGNPVPMDGENLWALFPTASSTVEGAQPTADDFVLSIVNGLKNGVSDHLDLLEELPGVQQHGVDPRGDAEEAIELLGDYRDRLRFLGLQHERYYASGEAANGAVAEE
jgi:hypothetical protein